MSGSQHERNPGNMPDRYEILKQQNRYLLMQNEALRRELSIREDEIVRLSRMLLEADEASPRDPS